MPIRYRFLCLLFFSLQLHAQVSWPSITQQNKPWTRWWWEGSAVSRQGLSWDLQQYRDAGLGGVEITPIYGIHGYEKDFVSFLSPAWMQLFDHTLREAKRLDLGVDLANATGWPFGGPWVTDADASKTVYCKRYSLKAGERLKEPVEYRQELLVRSANSKAVDAAAVLQPLSANKDLQALALDQVQFAGKLPLIALMAYSETGETIDLMPRLNAQKLLNWEAPNGKWELYALFQGLHGKMVERAAPGGEGYAIDHFSGTAAVHYFKKFDDAFKGHDISYLRAFFNDSYEVDDAKGQGNWTDSFFAEFKKRKGYDLRLQLPALFGAADGEQKSRVTYDYRSVIDELLLEHFTREWKSWGKSKGALLRNQSHGSPANTLDLYSVVDIPETEGTDILRFKFASSAANVSGKQLASSESATWLNEHFLSSWGDVKKAIDKYFLGGVNHIFYHGTAYSPKEAPWPGWLFYAAVHFQPVNPQWKDFHQLNAYISRAQSFLQSARPDNDILLYYPIADRYSEPGNVLLQHFDGMERNFEHTDFEKTASWLLEKGYAFDFFSDRQLQAMSVNAGKLVTGGNQYKVILLPANHFIPFNTWQKLLSLASQGATIIFYKDLPSDTPGLAQHAQQAAAFKKSKDILQWKEENDGTRWMRLGKGQFRIIEDLPALAGLTGMRNEAMVSRGLQFYRKKNKDGFVYFISNPGSKEINDWIPLSVNAGAVALFDAMSEAKGIGRIRKSSTGHGVEIYVQMPAFSSLILQTYNAGRIGNEFPYYDQAGDPVEIKGEWDLHFLDGGPIVPPDTKTDRLQSWTTIAGEAGENFSGTASYRITFKRPSAHAGNWLLDLGIVHETAELRLNGKSIGTLIGPAFQIVIPGSLLNESNVLEVVVANLMANRIRYMDKNEIPWKIFYNTNMPARRRENMKDGLFNAASWNPLPSGLMGPVTLTPIR